MADVIRKVEEEESPAAVVAEEQPNVYEKVTERVERFTIEQIDSQIVNLQKQIVVLEVRKEQALLLEDE